MLVGFMGAGKTSAGKAAARLLDREFIDLDDRIEQSEQKSVREIFAENGEAYFRRCERRELRKLLAETSAPRVIALGGGAYVDGENASALRDSGATVIFLDAPVEELRERVGSGTGRPLAQDAKRFAELYEQRRAAYEQAAFRVNTSMKSITEVAEEIARLGNASASDANQWRTK